MKNILKLKVHELIILLFDFTLLFVSFFLTEKKDYLTFVASILGIIALIFVSKGKLIGQILTIVFSLFYGYISFQFHYYGEMVTYLFMTAPMALIATISWMKNPCNKTNSVKIYNPNSKDITLMIVSSIFITIIFYFILDFLGNENLVFSTISITTSFIAVYLTYLRSPYYALAYASNDIILIILWLLALKEDQSYIVMVACFIAFLINDLYGFFYWKYLESAQKKM